MRKLTEARKEAKKQEYLRNRERYLAYKREWRLKNRDKMRAKTRAWVEENHDQHKANLRKNYQAKKGSYLARNKLRIEHIRQATPKWADLTAIREFYEMTPEGCHVDHIVPLRGENVCGLHVENNLQYLTARENIAKGNKTWQ